MRPQSSCYAGAACRRFFGEWGGIRPRPPPPAMLRGGPSRMAEEGDARARGAGGEARMPAGPRAGDPAADRGGADERDGADRPCHRPGGPRRLLPPAKGVPTGAPFLVCSAPHRFLMKPAIVLPSCLPACYRLASGRTWPFGHWPVERGHHETSSSVHGWRRPSRWRRPQPAIADELRLPTPCARPWRSTRTSTSHWRRVRSRSVGGVCVTAEAEGLPAELGGMGIHFLNPALAPDHGRSPAGRPGRARIRISSRPPSRSTSRRRTARWCWSGSRTWCSKPPGGRSETTARR